MTKHDLFTFYNFRLYNAAQYASLEFILNHEMKEKYFDKYTAKVQANYSMRAVPSCFNSCIKSVDDTFLNPDEKNWMRECFFKRINAQHDLQMYAMERILVKTQEGMSNPLGQ